MYTKQYINKSIERRNKSSQRRLIFSQLRNTNKKKIISQGPDEDYGAVQTENQIVDIPITEYEKKKVHFLSKLKLTSKKIHALERRTVDQFSSDKWRRQRKMRLTASNFGKIAKLRATTLGQILSNIYCMSYFLAMLLQDMELKMSRLRKNV